MTHTRFFELGSSGARRPSRLLSSEPSARSGPLSPRAGRCTRGTECARGTTERARDFPVEPDSWSRVFQGRGTAPAATEERGDATRVNGVCIVSPKTFRSEGPSLTTGADVLAGAWPVGSTSWFDAMALAERTTEGINFRGTKVAKVV